MKTALIYLASGHGRRFGSNKLLYSLDGKRPLFQYGLTTLRHAATHLAKILGEKPRLLVVTAHTEIEAYCRSKKITVIKNDCADEGIAASMRYGIQAAGSVDCYCFFVADQPCLSVQTVVSFVEGFARSGLTAGCVCSAGTNGSPTAFRHLLKDGLLAIYGDRGGRQLLCTLPNIYHLEVPQRELQDIDTESDLQLIVPTD